jgi:hypothetical protein
VTGHYPQAAHKAAELDQNFVGHNF